MKDNKCKQITIEEGIKALETYTKPKLTSRENDVYDLLLEGNDVSEVASKLVITISTAKGHIHHILNKFAVKSTRELLAKRIKQLEQLLYY